MNFYTKPIKTNNLCPCGGNLEYGWGNNNYPGSGMFTCSVCGKSSSLCTNPTEALIDFESRHKCHEDIAFHKEAHHD